MEYQLYNQNRLVLTFDLDTESNMIDEILSIACIEAAPLSIRASYELGKDILFMMNHWFHRRYIPDYRMGFYDLLESFEMFDLYEYHPDYHAMGLMDQYWVKSANSQLTYHDLHYQKDYPDFYNYLFYQNRKPLESYHDPNITTDGMLKKAWKYENGKYYLYKVSMFDSNIEPYLERLAYLIGKYMHMNNVEYTIEDVNGQIASKCECFIHKDIEYVACDELTQYLEVIDHEHYITYLEEKGIKDARRRIEEMIILDYLILNIDRHPYNFGVIRNVNTLEYLSVAPLFDHGNSLFAFHKDIQKNKAKDLLQNEHQPDYFLQYIQDLSKYDLNAIDLALEQFKKEMLAWPIDSSLVEKMIAIVLNQKELLIQSKQ